MSETKKALVVPQSIKHVNHLIQANIKLADVVAKQYLNAERKDRKDAAVAAVLYRNAISALIAQTIYQHNTGFPKTLPFLEGQEEETEEISYTLVPVKKAKL